MIKVALAINSSEMVLKDLPSLCKSTTLLLRGLFIESYKESSDISKKLSCMKPMDL